MPLLLNIIELTDHSERLKGELPVSDLEIGFKDEVVAFSRALKFDLEAQLLQDAILVTGQFELPIECKCVRCLKPVKGMIHLRNWACHLPLEGEDRPPIVRDSVDLTPYLREDIVLALPTHPVCRDDCPGLTGSTKNTLRSAASTSEGISSPWDELNKLKLKS